MQRSLLILRESEIRTLLDAGECIEAVEKALAAYSTRRAQSPAVINLDIPESHGEIHVKAGHLTGGSHYAVKVASGFYGNPERGLPQNDGLVLVFDARTGVPAALLLDNGYITDLRTGAAGAVAARHLARRDARVVGVVGSGGQARFQVEALARVRAFREVRLWGRRPERARARTEELARLPGMPPGCRFVPVATVREAVEGADIVVTVTASHEPLVQDEWVAPGTHVNAVGSDGPDKQELQTALLARADRLVADSRAQCLRLGEIHHAVASGMIAESKIDAELGEIAAGIKPGRRTDSEITVCDLTGVGVQDVAAAALVLARARDAGRGERLAL
ncbi:MAG TPA: ornithine cyclodeaminase family protein [Candidatus Polarisedimenticolia bacterium]|nr:ornithine cyclodeaminase family protein [Candidatus Polarisedimenticolia bacterium]